MALGKGAPEYVNESVSKRGQDEGAGTQLEPTQDATVGDGTSYPQSRTEKRRVVEGAVVRKVRVENLWCVPESP